jgi:hypothetical protein
MLNEFLTVLLMITMKKNDSDFDHISSKSSEIIIYNIKSYLKEDLDYNKLINKIKFKEQSDSNDIKNLYKEAIGGNRITTSRSCFTFNTSTSIEFSKFPINQSNSTPFLTMVETKSNSMTDQALRYASPSTSTISSCFFYDQAFYDSMGRNNSAKDDKNTNKPKNFLKKLFQKKKSKTIDKPVKSTSSNFKINSNNYLEPTYLNDLSLKNVQSKGSQKFNSDRLSSSVDSNDTIESLPYSVTKLTITDELNRTKLVAKSSPEILENYKNVVETTVKSLQSVQELMVENLQQFYDRGKQLDSLEEKANELQRESSFLHLTSKQVKSSRFRMKMKTIYIIILTISFIIIFVALILYISSNTKKR